MPLVPTSFLFRYTIPVRRIDTLPRAKAPLLKMPAACDVPFPTQLDQQDLFAKLKLAWNRQGFGVSVSVTGKSDWPECKPDSAWNSDGLRIWIDTRDTRTIHRASKFCHHFCLIPIGEGDDGTRPVVRQLPIPRASEDAPEVDGEEIICESTASESGYTLTAWFPGNVLLGFDPESQARLGFCLVVNDRELGQQTFSVANEFPFEADPALWASLELVAE